MKDRIINFIKNDFYRNIVSAIFGIILTAFSIYNHNDFLAILWGIIAGCEIGMAYLNKEKR